ncbi:hypothetical protein MBLNU459_g1357t1 [Dothideomycetes sp. NU459]
MADRLSEQTRHSHLMSAQQVQEKLAAQALREFDGIGIREVLDADSRPTFVIDLDPDVELTVNKAALSPIFGNASLRTYERLWDTFKTWAVSRTSFDDSGDIYPSTYVFFGMLWTGSTVRKRWRLISGNRSYQLSNGAASDLSSGPPIETAQALSLQPSPEKMEKRRRLTPRSHGRPGLTPHSVHRGDLSTSYNPESTVISSLRPQTTKESDPQESSYSSIGGKSTESVNLDNEHLIPDWTTPKTSRGLSEHIAFVRAFDWASSPLGDMRSWSPEFRQVANLVMKNPHSAALFWGPDLRMMYNQAYREVCAGRKHPTLMGAPFREVFSEVWDTVADLFYNCARTGIPINMENQLTPIDRNGILEECYFTWSVTPLYGLGSKILGFYNAPFETTHEQINKRRLETLRKLGVELSSARTVSDFWTGTLRGLEENVYDVPVAILYSVVDADDGDLSSHSGSEMSLKSCILEGGLGIPEGHPAAPARLDLKRSTEGFVPSFREAMRTRAPTKLQTRDGTLPESLLEGIQWRGWEEPCREAIIFPVRPTNGENVMAFLLIGVNPRRPYDGTYSVFVDMLNRQLATSLASVILFEEETRRGQTLSEQLAMQTLRMQRMTEMSPVGMYFIDEYGVLVEANDRYYEITGHPRGDDSHLSFAQTIHEDSLAAAMSSWEAYTLVGERWQGELRLRKPWSDPLTGEILENWILAAGVPDHYPDGRFRNLMGSITDISRIKWAENLKNVQLKEAEATKHATNTYLDLTSHELRNPLSAMIHCADEIQAVLKEVKMDNSNEVAIKDCLEAASTISLCAHHQKNIVDDILTVSKLDSDLLLITPTSVDPVAITRQAVKMFDAELRKKNVNCTYLVEPSYKEAAVDHVCLDQSRVLQVLINLLTNAIKFTQDEAEKSITVRLSASVTPPRPNDLDRDFEYVERKSAARALESDEWGSGELLYLQFQVQDTGRGLTKDEKKRLFIRFSQATPRTHAQYGGSGLGLFISRQLTELHGGAIGVGSEAGVGSTFAFYIRCRRSSAALQPDIVSPQPTGDIKPATNTLKETLPLRTNNKSPDISTVVISPQPVDFTKLHVLIVEDNLVNQKVLSKQLRKLGCNVDVADHGGHALDYIEKSRLWNGNQQTGKELTIILMDLEMPVMGGLACVERIRQFERDGDIVVHIPVIAVTANVRSELVVTAKQSGMDDVVTKPFRVPELMGKISELLA